MLFRLENHTETDLVWPTNPIYDKLFEQISNALQYYHDKYPCLKYTIEKNKYGFYRVEIEPIYDLVRKKITNDLRHDKHISICTKGFIHATMINQLIIFQKLFFIEIKNSMYQASHINQYHYTKKSKIS